MNRYSREKICSWRTFADLQWRFIQYGHPNSGDTLYSGTIRLRATFRALLIETSNFSKNCKNRKKSLTTPFQFSIFELYFYDFIGRKRQKTHFSRKLSFIGIIWKILSILLFFEFFEDFKILKTHRVILKSKYIFENINIWQWESCRKNPWWP